MQTLDELKAIAKLEAEHGIANLCPLPPKSVMLTGCGERAWITYEAPTMWAALDILTKFKPLAFYKYKGTFTSYKPESVHLASKRPEGEHDGTPYFVGIETNQGQGFGPDALLFFFVRLGEDVCKVRVQLKEGYTSAGYGYAATYFPPRKLDRRTVQPGHFNPNGNLSGMCDTYTRWATGDDKAANFTYAIAADGYPEDDETCEGYDATLRLENIAGTCHGERPEVTSA
jgi:hypothetical protein